MIAVKRLHSAREEDFKKEEEMLKELAKNEHPHIIKLLATFKMAGRYHLMFPWANRNLRTYWNDHPSPEWNPKTLMWCLEQMKGLASALEAIHNFKQQACNNPSQLVSPGYARSGTYRFGRHGDIKPENILWFADLDNCGESGMFQIADFGVARFNSRESRSRVDPRTIVSTPTYEPPEIALELKITRAYDIWSLACVFLEHITWTLGGSKMLKDFSSARLFEERDGYFCDKFYKILGDKRRAIVPEAVFKWMSHLHKHEKCSEVIHDLLDLVQDHLLVINAEDRMTSTILAAELLKFTERAHTDKAYLCDPIPDSDTVTDVAERVTMVIPTTKPFPNQIKPVQSPKFKSPGKFSQLKRRCRPSISSDYSIAPSRSIEDIFLSLARESLGSRVG